MLGILQTFAVNQPLVLAQVKHSRHRVKDLSLYAGKNLEISSTLSSSQSADGNFARTVLDQLASVKVTGEGGRLTLHSDDNLTIKAANIESQGSLKATADKTSFT
ncbi:hypothetical protein [Histophilus somni]|uniref:hypothetical protein n=1 Tax=Histophilus somni TaxID=731 RepID=UPI0038780F72